MPAEWRVLNNQIEYIITLESATEQVLFCLHLAGVSQLDHDRCFEELDKAFRTQPQFLRELRVLSRRMTDLWGYLPKNEGTATQLYLEVCNVLREFIQRRGLHRAGERGVYTYLWLTREGYFIAAELTAEKQDPELDDIFRHNLRDWLEVCIDKANSGLFSNREGFEDVEQEVAEIIFPRRIPGGKPHPFFLKEDGLRVAEQVTRWFVLRYNLLAAFRICQAVAPWGRKRKRDKAPFFPLSTANRDSLPLLVALALVALLLVVWPWYSYSENSSATSLWYHIVSLQRTTSEVLFSKVLGFYYLMIVVLICLSLQTVWSYLFLPRLIASIFVGFVAVVIGEELWKFSISATLHQHMTIDIVIPTLALLYLWREIRNTIPDIWLSLKRAATIWLLGILEALLVSCLFYEWFGLDYANAVLNDEIRANLGRLIKVDGVFQVIVPTLVIFQGVLALLLGIVLQIFWEDKPITHPF